ncbi:hypothetical protein [Xenorhabdus ishibashii]|uniref:Uncharacterized protein n=1 Tax=Xenorhabdus ishibashii TaxID=1034471 RepID=A0A2D0K7X7_9GAMM|nr:hypothetical protein [Xenorhabdus ishibashii]PHM59548.1 hypothetical protein Xish_03667 [Xenorhabdus ishibashii]
MQDSDGYQDQRKRLSLKIPNKVSATIEKIIEHRINNGDDDLPINRTAVAIEMMVIGAQVLKKSLEDSSDVQKAYTKEFETVVKLILSCEYFSRMAASNSGEIDYLKNSDELIDLRKRWADAAKELLS